MLLAAEVTSVGPVVFWQVPAEPEQARGGGQPEGGDGGGNIVAIGTPEEVAKNPNSYTGQFLSEQLNKP